MIDYTKNDYLKIGVFSNVVLERAKGFAPVDDIRINAVLEEVIRKVALMHPEWTIVGQHATGITPLIVSDFRFYEGIEELGRVNKTDNEYKIDIDNHRIRAGRIRSGGMTTKDPKKALKIIEDNFAAKSVSERISDANKAVAGDVRTMNWRKNQIFKRAIEHMAPAMAAYIVQNMDSVTPALVSMGAPADMLRDLPTILEDLNAAKQMTIASITTVVTYGDSYILMLNNDMQQAITKQAHELDMDMRGKLGILKTCEVKSDLDPIENVGVRINETTFVVVN